PENLVKFSGIGCSSKSPAYFLGRSFCFNGLHGRMPSLALGALFADKTLEAIGISGDGDTASIGFGQFKHLIRRNLPLVYIIENNGVYGLTKGQFSATAEKGLSLKRQGTNPFTPVDLAMEALISEATFVARSFAGDPKQVKQLIKAAIAHQGIAVIDIISPCVTFHNHENSFHSYSFGKTHEEPLHEISLVLAREEITVDDFERGTTKEVTMYDGSVVLLKKLENEYDPTDKWQALRTLEDAANNNWLLTGLIYVNPTAPTLFDKYNLPDTPLNRLPADKLRPSPQSLEQINQSMF
ncbi:MAG TPA: thiamine pyrophosphate-dependent enzyme, partial [Anaerolineaceae bacterium]|nr:thiamine pyrophosphate-dependent enzyme [Anaerolineaceae bacterium]